MPTQNLLRLLLLLMLVMRIVLATVKAFVQNLSTRFKGLVKILKLMFRQDFEAEVWSVFCCCFLVEVTKLNLGQYSEARFGQDFRFSRDAESALLMLG